MADRTINVILGMFTKLPVTDNVRSDFVVTFKTILSEGQKREGQKPENEQEQGENRFLIKGHHSSLNLSNKFEEIIKIFSWKGELIK